MKRPYPPSTRFQVRAFRRTMLAVMALIGLLTLGTVGYRWLEDLDFVDALYMTVITLSTVGFGEVHPLSPVGRMFTVSLIVGGGGLAAYTLSGIAEFLFSGELRIQWDHQRRTRMLQQLSDHIIICGYGRMGRNVAHALKGEGLPFVVIDPNPEKIEHVREMGYLALQANAADETHLEEAGIRRARGLVAAANSDAENVFIVLTARSLHPKLLIVARANFEESEQKLVRAGADRVILPYRISGRRVATVLLRPEVDDFLDEVSHSSGMELLLEQIHLAPTSPLVGQTLAQAQLGSRLGVTVLACKLPEQQLNTRPSADTVLKANAKIIVLGTRDQLQAVMHLARG
ncbi:MAG: NAD-binding protein [Acidobacteriota bacterium]